MTTALQSVQISKPVGRLSGVTGNVLHVTGLPIDTRLGDRVSLRGPNGAITGEIIRLSAALVDVLIDGSPEGLAVGMMVRRESRITFSPHPSWIGRVIDPDGQPLDGRPLLPGTAPEIGSPQLQSHSRRGLGKRMETGIAAINTLLPLVQGQRVGLFAGSGVGKSTLLGSLARGINADVIVIALVGERGREVVEFTEKTLGAEGMARAVVVAATSDRPPNLRRKCIWSATRVAEYFRDQGMQVLLLCDSITRFCEAHREVAVASGEPANLRGFPASTQGSVAALCERAGPGQGDAGDITAVYTVLVAGSDMEEPVADMMRGILDGHIVLERRIAEAGRFPAIDVLRSVSRALPETASATENEIIADARRQISVYEGSEAMIRSGLYEGGSDPAVDAAIACRSSLERFLTIIDGRAATAHFAALKQSLSHGRGPG